MKGLLVLSLLLARVLSDDPGPPPDAKGRVPQECLSECDDNRCCYLRCACARGYDPEYREWACRKARFYGCNGP